MPYSLRLGSTLDVFERVHSTISKMWFMKNTFENLPTSFYFVFVSIVTFVLLFYRNYIFFHKL